MNRLQTLDSSARSAGMYTFRITKGTTLPAERFILEWDTLKSTSARGVYQAKGLRPFELHEVQACGQAAERDTKLVARAMRTIMQVY
jgi:hypothetical protein